MTYVAMRRRPRSYFDDSFTNEPPPIVRDVIIEDDAPVSTGLLDQHGTPIYRTADKIKMSFSPT